MFRKFLLLVLFVPERCPCYSVWQQQESTTSKQITKEEKSNVRDREFEFFDLLDILKTDREVEGGPRGVYCL